MKQSISESEWAVMEALWQLPGATLAQVVERLQGSGWQYTTIRTLLARLVEKGFVQAQRNGKASRYTATVPADACRMEQAQDFLGRVYRGSVAAMVSGLARQGRVSRQEITELKQMIDAMEADDECQN